MTENIKTLLSDSTTEEEKINAANNIITNYNLHLTNEEILSVFTKARLEICFPYYYANNYDRFVYLLNQKIDMFIAMAKCCSDKEKKTKPFWILSCCVISDGYLHTESNQLYSRDEVVKMYKNFLDYHNFDIDNLVMSKESREEIEEYRNEKYGGSLTKSAKK